MFVQGRDLLIRILMDADEGSGSGTLVEDVTDDDQDASDTEPSVKYTDDDVQRMITQRLRKANKEAEELRKQNEELKSKADKQKKDFDLDPEIDTNPDNRNRLDEGQRELERRKLDAKLRELEEQNREAQAKLEREIAQRRELMMDSEISAALQDSGCIDVPRAKKMFRDQIEWDEDEQKFYYKTEKENLVSIAEGIKAEIPEYLVRAAMRGGAGGVGNTARKGAKQKERDTLVKKVEAAQKAAETNPRDAFKRSLWNVAKKELAKFDKENNVV